MKGLVDESAPCTLPPIEYKLCSMCRCKLHRQFWTVAIKSKTLIVCGQCYILTSILDHVKELLSEVKKWQT